MQRKLFDFIICFSLSTFVFYLFSMYLSIYRDTRNLGSGAWIIAFSLLASAGMYRWKDIHFVSEIICLGVFSRIKFSLIFRMRL